MGFLNTLVERLKSSDLIRKIGETFATRVVQLALTLITSVLIARALGPEGRGLFAVASAVTGILVQIANLGLHSANTYFVARSNGEVAGKMGGNAILVALLCVPFCILVWAVFSGMGEKAPLEGAMLLLALAAVPVSLLYMQFQNIVLGMQEVRAVNKVEISVSLLALILLATMFISGTEKATWFYAVVAFTQVLGVGYLIKWLFSYHNKKLSVSISLLKESLGYGFKAYISTMFSFLVFRADTLMVNHFRGVEETGQYAIAMSLINMMYILPTVAATLVFAKMCGMSDFRERVRLGAKYGWAIFGIMLVMVIVVVPLSKFIVVILFGREYLESVVAFLCLLPGLLAMSGEIVVRKALTSDGYHKGIMINWGVAFLLNIGLNMVLIPEYGIKGAAISSSVSIALVAMLNLMLLVHEWRRAYV